MINSELPLYDSFARLAPFALRARVVATGREKLLQHRNQLAFLLVTEDLSDNSRREVLKDFPCPIYQALTASQVENLFHFHNTKLLGFSRCSLSTQIQQLLKGCRLAAPTVEQVQMPEQPTVAVLGASGVGRFHASWWEKSGARVCAFLGSGEDSVSKTETLLTQLLAHPVKGYIQLDRLLLQAKPDIVDVCLPPALHFRAARAALLAGCHVLCEKPFLYDDALPPAVLHQQCQELVALANARNRLLGMCSQYHVIAKECLELLPDSNEAITKFKGTLLTPLRNQLPDAPHTWIDLGPHLLAMVQAVATTRHLLQDSIRVEIRDPMKATIRFLCTDRTDTPNPPPPLECTLTTGRLTPKEADLGNLRSFYFNDQNFSVQNAKAPDGTFALGIRSHLTSENLRIFDDPMRTLIDSFAHGKALIPGRRATQNLNWLLKIEKAFSKK